MQTLGIELHGKDKSHLHDIVRGFNAPVTMLLVMMASAQAELLQSAIFRGNFMGSK